MATQSVNSVQAAPIMEPGSLLDRIVEQQAIDQARVASRYKPVMSTKEMVEREEAINFLVSNIMREGIDYGWVPGTKPATTAKPGEYQAKPTLFKAGAERACAFFGYVPHFEEDVAIEEWTTSKFGEPLFYYKYRCTLLKDGAVVGEGFGSGSTWESKYRYRKGERECPECGKAGSIIKGKTEYGGGWLCFGKKGGCGAKFADGDEAIESQVTDRIANPDVADTINTVQKMAQKRAYVASTLTATGLSGRFTQDLEDIPLPQQFQEQSSEGQKPAPRPAKAGAQQHEKRPAPQTVAAESPQQAAALNLDSILATFTNIRTIVETFQRFRKENLEPLFGAVEATKVYYRALKASGVDHSNEFRSPAQAKACFSELWGEYLNAKNAPPHVEDAFDRHMAATEAANG